MPAYQRKGRFVISRTRFIPLAGLIATLALAPSAGAAVPKDFVGIESPDTYQYVFNGDAAGADRNLAEQRGVRIGIHRQQFKWEDIETRKGRYNFGVTDAYVGRMASNNMRILPVLFDAPAFHAKGKDRPGSGLFFPPKSGKSLGKFGAAVIKRYGPRGSFWRANPSVPKIPIRSYQMWNETNLRFYWGGKPNAKQYVAVLKGAYPIMKKADRKAEIVTAGLPQSNTRGAIPLKTYIAQMYRAGAKRWFDTMGLNAYARNSKDLLSKLKLVRSQMSKGRDGKAKLWITEMGWADSGSKHYLVKGALGQAREIKNSIALIKKERTRRKLRGFVYYQWRDTDPHRSGIDPGTWGFHAGLLKENYVPKRALNAFKSAVAKL